MIRLTKLNKEEFYINPGQIQMIEMIPEAKIVFMNKEYLVVRETPEEIVRRIIAYNASILNSAKVTFIAQKKEEPSL